MRLTNEDFKKDLIFYVADTQKSQLHKYIITNIFENKKNKLLIGYEWDYYNMCWYTDYIKIDIVGHCVDEESEAVGLLVKRCKSNLNYFTSL